MIGYFETSALVKLFLEEDGSDLAARAWEDTDVRLTSRISYPEARAALAAAHRDDRLSGNEHARAKRRLAVRVDETALVELTERIASLAGDLAERHRLRGFDAIHLASAVGYGDPDLILVTWDGDLVRAAGEAGLSFVAT